MRERGGIEEGLDEKLSTPARGGEGSGGRQGAQVGAQKTHHTTVPLASHLSRGNECSGRVCVAFLSA
jgi:hypothetical protein